MIGGIFETIGKTLGIGKEKYFLELDDAAEGVANKVQEAADSAVKTAKDVSGSVADTLQSKADDASSAANKAKTAAKKEADKVASKADNASDKAAKNAGEAVDKAASKADKEAAKFNKKANKLIKEGDAKVKVSANEETGEVEATAIETDKGKKPSKKSAKQVIANKQSGASEDGSPASEPKTIRDPEDIIREALAKAQKAPDGKPVDPEAAETFSTDYLMPLGNRGRRRPGPSFSNYKNMARDTNPRLKS